MTAAEREAIRQEEIRKLRDNINSYAHMCRDGHIQIGHNDSDFELCPLCREKNRADDVIAEVSRLQGLLDRQQEVRTVAIKALERVEWRGNPFEVFSPVCI